MENVSNEKNKVVNTENIKRVCSIHGEYIATIFRNQFLTNAIETECPICEELKEQEEAKIKAAAKSKQESEVNEQKLRDMRIRRRYYDASFSKIEIQDESQKFAVNCLKRMTEVKKGTVVLLSENGFGKTYMAISALRVLGGKYYKMSEISALIRSTYTSGNGKTELDVIEELSSLPLLIIDEIGRTKASEAELNWLSEIIDNRQSDYMPTVLLSNKILAKNCPKKSQSGCEGCQDKRCFDHYVGSDILSRLQMETAIIQMTGSDRRVA